MFIACSERIASRTVGRLTPERLRQAALGRQPLAGREPAVEDHVLDRPDRVRDVGAAGQRLELELAHIAQNGS